MKYRNDTAYFRQAGDAMVPPGGLSPDLDAPPLGEGWTPIFDAHTPATATAPQPEPIAPAEPEPVAEEPKRRKR